MRIVVTDCDHDNMLPEQSVALQYGVDLIVSQCRTEEDVIAAAVGAAGLVVQYAPITRSVLSALPDLRAVGRYGVGVDTIDIKAATDSKVAVCNVPDYGTEDVSDHAVALALSVSRATARLDRQMRNGGYDYSVARPLYRTKNQVFGVLGMGRIGLATARKASGIGFDVIGFDTQVQPGETREGILAVGLDELLSRADIISIHMPLTSDTRHFLSHETLGQMKSGSIIINTSRGGIIDTNALSEAISSGKIGGAGLDVFEEEPVPRTSPLFKLENVVLTPHIAWYSEESFGELKTRAIENVVAALSGKMPRNILNPEVLS